MTDEEKEIFKNLKEYMQNEIYNGYNKFIYNDLGWDFKCIDCINAIDTAINLIENQSNEIEELKENIRKRIIYSNELEKDLFENCSNYVVSKDKIRAKIEIRKEEKEICKDSIEEKYLLREIYILQSLLEEEE